MQWTYLSLILASLIQLSSCLNFQANTLDPNITPSAPLFPENTFNQHPNASVLNLDKRQTVGLCGPTNNNAICNQNQCCSQFGYCGTGDAYCSEITNCQPLYGRCGNTPLPSSTSSASPPPSSTSTSFSTTTVVPTTSTTPIISLPTTTTTSSSSIIFSTSTTTTSILPSSTLTPSLNGRCGNSTTCTGTGFGSCCSQFFYCGNTNDYCGVGCNPLFGSCGVVLPSSSSSVSSSTPVLPTSSTSIYTPPPPPTTSSTSIFTPPPPTPTTPTSTPTAPSSTPSATPGPGLTSSTDGTCGGTTSCAGSSFGNCCSRWGYCGSSAYYCSLLIGCQVQFGVCGTS